ncbi:MAG: ribosome silencing factor [Phycisphaeraceae bacterium]|nr:ribosome silencing factor [Phycisphaeraceae bacterium]
MADSDPKADPAVGLSGDSERLERRGQTAAEKVRTFVLEGANLLRDRHLNHILVYDVREQTEMTDYVMIASATSERQLRSVSDELADLAGEYGLVRLGSESDEQSKWLVLDLVDVVVHLFEPATRAHYDLEMLWGESPEVPWQSKAQGSSDESSAEE